MVFVPQPSLPLLQSLIEARVDTGPLLAEVSSDEAQQEEILLPPASVRSTIPVAAEVSLVNGKSPLGIPQIGTYQGSSPQFGLVQDGSTQISISQVSFVQANITKVGITQIGSAQVDSSQVTIGSPLSLPITVPTQVSFAQVGPAQISTGQSDAPKKSSLQINAIQISSTEIPLTSSITLQHFLSSHNYSLQNTTIPTRTSLLQGTTPFKLNIEVN